MIIYEKKNERQTGILVLSFYIELDIKFPTFNKYIDAERRNRFVASKMKKEYTEMVKYMVLKHKGKKLEFPIQIEFNWYARTSSRDIDGYSFAKKCILDGMKNAGIIPDDNIKIINKTIDEVTIAKKDGVIMKITSNH